jgi:PAS domain S-box-containing protein
MPIHIAYDYRLLSLSVAISILAFYVGLDFAGRVIANRGSTRLFWLISGSCAMGSGLWGMHFTGMLAYRLPIPIYYHLPTVILSLFIAIMASYVVMYVASRRQIKRVLVVSGGMAMGAGIAAMHYTAMAAMRLAATPYYDPGILLKSMLLAMAVSLAGLQLVSRFCNDSGSWVPKVAVALVLGLAIPEIHYTGMAAVSFMPTGIMPDLSNSVDIAGLATFSILAISFQIPWFALSAASVDRRLAAQHSALNDERKMLRALIDNMPDFIYVKDLQSRFLVANPHLARAVGLRTPEDLLGRTDFEIYPNELATAFYADDQNVISSGTPLYNREEKGIDRDGKAVEILTTKVPVRDTTGKIIGIAGIGRDISQRKKAEQALREAEQNYREIFDKAIVGIFQSTPSGQLLSVNPSMAFTFGYNSPEEMIAGVPDFSQHFFVDDRRRGEFTALMDRIGAVQNFECQVLQKDSSRIWISLSVRVIRQNGSAVRYLGMNENITERKVLREQLFQAQKLESVGQLAAGIAHEINTPTQYIGDNVRFLKDAFQDLRCVLASYGRMLSGAREGDLSGETIKEICEAVDRADPAYLLEEIPKAIDQTLEGVLRVSTLVGAMKEFSHPGTKEKIPLDLNHAIGSTITVARNEWKYVADMETEFDPSLPMIPCLPGEFNQVILNLIVNAAHAIADVYQPGCAGKGKIKVQTENCRKWAEIRVIDTGSGIPAEVRSRIFDPFFTTKEIGKGTGQGLAIARSVVVDKHGGTIDFETEEGKGTTFIIRLPRDGKPISRKGIAA